MGSASPSQHHRRVLIGDLPGHRTSLVEDCRYGPLVLTDSGEDIAAVVSLEVLYRALSVLHARTAWHSRTTAPRGALISYWRQDIRPAFGRWQHNVGQITHEPTGLGAIDLSRSMSAGARPLGAERLDTVTMGGASRRRHS